MKGKRASLLLIGLGVICIIIFLCMFWRKPTTVGKDKKTLEIVSEDARGENTQDTEEKKASVAAATTAIELQRDKPVHEINSDMYEWPHDNVWFEGYKEPDLVIYLAQNKKWFDELVGKFQQYKGRDISGLVGWDKEEQMVYYDHFLCEDVVPIYDKYEEFFHDGIISLFHVDGNNISFQSARDSHEYLYYYYDESRNEETDEFLESTYIVHVAPHWWWREPAAPH